MPKYEALIGIVDESSTDKATSSLLSKLFKNIRKKLIDTDVLNNFWRAGRSALDALAGSYGVPLSEFRQLLRNRGVDPDKYAAFLENEWGDEITKSVPQLNDDLLAAEAQAKTTSSTDNLLMIVGIALGAGLLFSGGRGKRIFGGARRFAKGIRFKRFKFRRGGFRRGRRR